MASSPFPDPEWEPNQAVMQAEIGLLEDITTDITSLISMEGGVQFLDNMGFIFRKDNIVVKSEVLTHDLEFSGVIHEACVGLLGTNTLNSPNFALVKGCMLCTEDVYVIYEYIKGPSLYQFMEADSVGPQDLAAVLLELFQALYKAWRAIDFTHYDLHPKNIIIRDGHPVMIDYGLSHFKYKEQNYGRLMSEGTIENRSMWQHDVFKILLNVYAHVRIDRKLVKLRSVLGELLDFFIYPVDKVKMSRKWYDYYQKDYKYHQVTNAMTHHTYNFKEFMELAVKLLA